MSSIRPFFLRAALALSIVAPVGFVSAPIAFAAEATFNGESVSTLGDDSKLTIGATRASGTGSFVFASKLDAIGEDTSHALSFLLKENGSLTFVAYADPSLGQGLEFVFTREGRTLKGLVRKNGDVASVSDFSAELANINASRVINLQIDVHNSEAPAHILLWDGLEASFSEDNAILNTEETDAAPGNGAGQRRGIVLKEGTLLKAVATEVKFQH